MPFQDDLYKSLLDESKSHRDKVSTIWLQKFTMLGAIVAFATTQSMAPGRNPSLVAAAILCLPLIAVLLDIKLAEFGVHAKMIDHFVMTNFTDPPVLAAWERTKWGAGESGAYRNLVRMRSVSTVAVTIIPTCVIAGLSVLAAKPYVDEATYRILGPSAWLFCLAYAAIGLFWVRLVLHKD